MVVFQGLFDNGLKLQLTHNEMILLNIINNSNITKGYYRSDKLDEVNDIFKFLLDNNFEFNEI